MCVVVYCTSVSYKETKKEGKEHPGVPKAAAGVQMSSLKAQTHTQKPHKVLRHTTVCECAHAVRVGTISVNQLSSPTTVSLFGENPSKHEWFCALGAST